MNGQSFEDFANRILKKTSTPLLGPERQKGLGYFGPLKRPDKMTSTELSISVAGPEYGNKETEIPLLVPTLTRDEVDLLLSGKEPTEEIYRKAEEHAQMRLSKGLSPFAQQGEQRSRAGTFEQFADERLKPKQPDIQTMVENLLSQSYGAAKDWYETISGRKWAEMAMGQLFAPSREELLTPKRAGKEIGKTALEFVTFPVTMGYKLLTDPQKTIVEEPLNTIFFLAMMKGAASAKIRAKAKGGQPVTKVDMVEAARGIPREKAPTLVDDLVANLPDDFVVDFGKVKGAKKMAKEVIAEMELPKVEPLSERAKQLHAETERAMNAWTKLQEKQRVRPTAQPEPEIKYVGESKTKILNPKEQKQWLLKEIDKAIEKIPEDMDAAADYRGKYPSVVFDVPGDGIFQILNDAKPLGDFRKAVNSRWPTQRLRIAEARLPSKKPLPPEKLTEALEPSYEELSAWQAARAQRKPVQPPAQEPLIETGKPTPKELAGVTEVLPPLTEEMGRGMELVSNLERLKASLQPEQPSGKIRPEGFEPTGGGAIPGGLPKEVGGIRLDKPVTDQGTLNILADIAAKLPARERLTWAETEIMAKELNLTPQQLQRWANSVGPQIPEAARQLNLTVIEDFAKASDRLAKDPSMVNEIAFDVAFHNALTVTANVRKLATSLGRSLGILRKRYTQAEDVRFLNIEQVLKKIVSGEIKPEVLERAKKLDYNNPLEIRKFLMEVSKPKPWQTFFEIWINNLLLNPATMLVNATSNLIVLSGRPLEKFVAAGFEALKGGEAKIPFKEAVYEVSGMMHGMREGWRKAAFAFKNEVPLFDVSKLEYATRPVIPGKVGRAVRLPGRVLMATDEFFKSVLYTSDMYAQGYRNAFQEAKTGKISQGQILERAEWHIKNPTDAMRQHAKRAALYGTFQKELGKASSKISALRKDLPALNFIIPFLRTPVNIVKFGLERTPINIPRIMIRALKGELTGEALSTEMAKIAVGTTTGLVTFMAALEGKITGSGPKDQNERAKLYRLGWQPYSIKIGDKYYQYSRLEPFGIILGLSADAAEIWHNIREGERDDLAARIILAITTNLSNKTFLQGLSSAMNAVSDPDRYGTDWIERFAGSALPSGVAALARATDPTVRETEGIIDYMKSRIPVVSKTLPPRQDIYGEPIVREGGFLGRFISPVRVSTEKKGDIDQELGRLGINIGMPGKRAGERRLTPKEYSEFSKMAGEELYFELGSLIDGYKYSMATDKDKAGQIRGLVSRIRAKHRSQLFPSSQKGWLSQLLE